MVHLFKFDAIEKIRNEKNTGDDERRIRKCIFFVLLLFRVCQLLFHSNKAKLRFFLIKKLPQAVIHFEKDSIRGPCF